MYSYVCVSFKYNVRPLLTTIFAPSDDAFAALPKETRDKITGDTDLLKKVLMFHVTSGRAYSSGLSNDMLVDSLYSPNKIKINVFFYKSTAARSTLLDPLKVRVYLHVYIFIFRH